VQLLYWILKKAGQKAGPANCWQKGGNKSLFLNLSCCCLETGLKPILFQLMVDLWSLFNNETFSLLNAKKFIFLFAIC